MGTVFTTTWTGIPVKTKNIRYVKPALSIQKSGPFRTFVGAILCLGLQVTESRVSKKSCKTLFVNLRHIYLIILLNVNVLTYHCP